MSGDVQPRKRKDKKRRKEDGDPAHPPVFANSPASDDVNIHVHKEGGTGGNICAKLVFFVLFSALAVLIGLIITEHRGLTDLDSVDAESRYSHIFEGLVDSGLDGHEDHEDNGIEEDFNSREIDQVDDHDDNDEELDVSELEEEEEEPSGEDDKSGGDQSEELSIEDSRADEPEEENESAVSQEQDEDDEVDEEIQNDEDEDDIPAEDDEIEDIDEEIDDAVEESDEYYQDEQQNSEEDNEEQNKVGTEEVDDAEEDETDDNGYDVEGNDEETENNADQIEGDDDDDGIEGNVDDVAEENELNEEEGFEHIKNKMDISDDDVEQASSAEDIFEETRHEDDIVHSSEEKVVENIFEEKESKIEEGQSEQDVLESSGMAVRLGVGIAILVVAHLVLVRKWRTADDSKLSIPNEQSEAVPDLSRRNTIIIPPNYQEIEADIENDEEDYSEELSDNEEPIEGNRATYLRSLTPDSDRDHEKSPKPYEYDDDENSIEEEEEINEEDYEIEDVDEEDDDDDEELLKRLEAKYGKLHGGGGDQVAESWKRINLRQDMIEDSDFDSDRQSDDEEYQNMNITNKDDFQIRKEIDEAQKSVESE